MGIRRKLDEEVINTIHYKEWEKAKAKTEADIARHATAMSKVR